MSSPVDREALARTALRVRKTAEKTGQKMTQQQAQSIVAKHLQKAENKRKRG